MKKLLILPLLLVFQIVSAQWNAIGWNPFTLRSTSGDSTFVLSAPSRVDLQKGTASWVPERQDSYLVYTALLTQSGTDAPVATVLENTLGGTVVWSYEGTGTYKATLTDAFAANKTWTSPSNDGFSAVSIVYGTTDYLTVYVGNFGGSNAGDLIDSGITNYPIEIRIYP